MLRHASLVLFRLPMRLTVIVAGLREACTEDSHQFCFLSKSMHGEKCLPAQTLLVEQPIGATECTQKVGSLSPASGLCLGAPLLSGSLASNSSEYRSREVEEPRSQFLSFF